MKIAIGSRQKFWEKYGDDLYKVCKKYGFDAIDCRMLTTPSDVIYTLSEKEIVERHKKERALADEAGVELLQTHAPFAWPSYEATVAEREAIFERMKRSLCCSEILGVKLWVMHPLIPMGHRDLTTGGAEVTREVNLEFIARLLPIAKECGVTICLENMPWHEFSIASPDEIREIVDTVNDENFKMCLDTGHANIYNKGLSVGDHARAQREVLRALHVHDNDGKQDQHRIPYDGYVNWADFGAAIREIGFDGPFTFESAPSSRLPTHLFEKHLQLQREIADSILGN